MGQMRTVGCPDETCRHNENYFCARAEITMEFQYGEMEQGHRTVYVACGNYEDRKDAGTD